MSGGDESQLPGLFQALDRVTLDQRIQGFDEITQSEVAFQLKYLNGAEKRFLKAIFTRAKLRHQQIQNRDHEFSEETGMAKAPDEIEVAGQDDATQSAAGSDMNEPPVDAGQQPDTTLPEGNSDQSPERNLAQDASKRDLSEPEQPDMSDDTVSSASEEIPPSEEVQSSELPEPQSTFTEQDAADIKAEEPQKADADSQHEGQSISDEAAGKQPGAKEPTSLYDGAKAAAMKFAGIPKVDRQPVPPPKPLEMRLPNAKQGQPYSAQIENLKDLVLRDDGGSGMSLSPDGLLSGTIDQSGQFKMRISGLSQGRSVTYNAILNVVGDPVLMWKKSIPSDPKGAFAKPDHDFDTSLGDAFIVAASMRGRSHARVGGYRDDDFAIHAQGPGGWHLMVACDGAGSAKFSRQGSRVAATVVMDKLPGLIKEHLDPDLDRVIEAYLADMQGNGPKIRGGILYNIFGNAAHAAVQEIKTLAQKSEAEYRDFYTTLLVAITRKVGENWFTASFTIGDGGIALIDTSSSEARLLCIPDGGEFAGQTRFLTPNELQDSAEIMKRIFIDVRPRFDYLALVTDGISDPLFGTEKNLENLDKWRQNFGAKLDVIPYPEIDDTDHDGVPVHFNKDNPQLEEEFLTWLEFFSKGDHDDRTIILCKPEGHA